jgi:hypothetical protein
MVGSVQSTAWKNMHAFGELNRGGALHHKNFNAIADVSRQNHGGGGAGNDGCCVRGHKGKRVVTK